MPGVKISELADFSAETTFAARRIPQGFSYTKTKFLSKANFADFGFDYKILFVSLAGENADRKAVRKKGQIFYENQEKGVR